MKDLSNSFSTLYIREIKINGRKYRKNYFRGRDLFEGDVTVEFVMGSEPDLAWGTRLKDCPPGIDGKRGRINKRDRRRWLR